ncbi:family 78 glycoside hydrolase catalytic domain [Paenibacillus methanolicus]|uniref:Alpha-L-rhamnosidase-like protein n=1 Tax=Paenibacillus methanolicus TaxID=582686 RepID=A0A5S5BY32_9BACL|nr:family 78 glycoside hydrolase catalytic domain [Paenibacillus methanolicus]TYP71947.1 alpha-L-rhamnosidase-like protein [Paenibacillus methanolicus]
MMDMSIRPDWEASWIWGSGTESPRNEWRCFRRCFVAPTNAEQAVVRLTADSRYVLFVNGARVGRGPVRSWPFELAYDEYAIGHLLRPGAENVIAVLVIHYGVSTFQYLRGRGGLLLQLDIPGFSGPLLATDDSWLTAVHRGHDPRTSRISCQLGFTESVDARAWDSGWNGPRYDDSGWEPATVIGAVGMKPWTRLVERGIPHLTEEPVYPARVEQLASVQPIPWNAVIDLRNLLVPESADHANNVEFSGYVATVVRLDEAAVFTIGIVDDGRIPCRVSIDGRWLEGGDYAEIESRRHAAVELQAGEHLLLLDVTGRSHGHGFHLGFDCDVSFDVYSPVPGQAGSVPFCAAGPFDHVEIIDHRPVRSLDRSHPDYLRMQDVSSADELMHFSAWIRTVDPQLVHPDDVFALSVWKKAETRHSVPAAMQHAVIAGADPAVIPVYAGRDTELVIDFGRELSGYIAFELDAAEGTIVDGYGLEYMKNGWMQHTYQLDNTFRYVCREGRQSYESYVRRGLRYLVLTIRGAARPVKLYELKLLQSNYPVADTGRFRSSDPLLSDIWKISRDTTRICMEDTFVDCPAYEQAYWVGDARNEALVNYYAFGAREIVERCLKLVPGSSFQTPLYADQVPSGWSSVIPNWTFFWVGACLEYYRYDGNSAFVADIWPHVKLTLDKYLSLLNDNGLFENEGWNLLDWAPFEQPEAGIVTPQNMFLVKALRDAAELGAIAGFGDEADLFVREAGKLRKAIDDHLWDSERAAYVDCIHADGQLSATISMQTQIVASLCGIAEGERNRLVERYIASPPPAFVQVGSPFMSFFYYEALAAIGRFDLLLADMRRNYGFMIASGATSCWEMYPWSGFSDDPRILTRSHCHAWSAGPVYFLGAHILGVQGLTPGWTKVRIAPQPCGLEWAEGSVPLPHEGRIDVAWRLTGEGELELRVEAPAHVELATVAPEGYGMKVERVTVGD